MAREINGENQQLIVLDRQEAVEIIGMLAAQLAGVAFRGRMSGEVPTISIVDKGVVVRRLSLVLDGTSEE